MTAASGAGAGAGIAGLLLIAIAVGAYFVPTIVGAIRKVPNIGSVVVVNIFLGWTLIGWVVALAMAARSSAPVHQTTVNLGGHAPPPPAPAGAWHPDPKGRPYRRWHDGQQWTEHVLREDGVRGTHPVD